MAEHPLLRVGRLTADTRTLPGSLTVVGLGLRVPAHVTFEAKACLERADDAPYLLADPVAIAWVESVNPRARPLHGHYEVGKPRRGAYEAMVESILAPVRDGARVCAAFYGHAGVCAVPSHEAVRRARGEGLGATMLPGISAEACLFADLGVDPLARGCQSYEATELLLRRPVLEPASALILWQAGTVGNLDFTPEPDRDRLRELVEYLARWYGPEHEVVLYEASPYPICEPILDRVALAELPAAGVSLTTTLYVPPSGAAREAVASAGSGVAAS